MPSAGFEPAIPASEQQKTHALARQLGVALLYFKTPTISDLRTHPLSVGTRFVSGDTSDHPHPP